MKFNAHDTAILIVSAHDGQHFALTRTHAEDEERSVYQMCLADYDLASEKESLLQKASKHAFAMPNVPVLRLCPAQDMPDLSDTNITMVCEFTYGKNTYQVHACKA